MPRHFANWLRAYADYTRDSEAPREFHFWTGVSTIAGALRRRVWIDMKKFEWVPNFYIILVGPAGLVTKSTTMRIGAALLENVEGVNFGPNSMTWQALGQSLVQSMMNFDYVDVDGEVKESIHSSITIQVPELGTFLKIEDSVLMDVMVALWDGQKETFGHKTVSNGEIKAKNPWINVIGCTTPSWLQNHFPESMIGGGLTSRIVFVYADKKHQFIPYPDEVIPSDEYARLREGLIADLQQIAELAGPYIITPEARNWGREWYQRLWSDRPLHMASDKFSGYIARKQTHIHKLAIVLAAAQREKLLIEKEDLMMADELLTGTERHMLNVFQSIGVVDEARNIREITALVKAHGTMTTNELWINCQNNMTWRDFESNLRIAVTSGKLTRITNGLGKPAVKLTGTEH